MKSRSLLKAATACSALGLLLTTAACSGGETSTVDEGSAATAAVTTSNCAIGPPGTAETTAPAGAVVSQGLWVQWDGDTAPIMSVSDDAPAVSSLVVADLVEGDGAAVAPGGNLTVNYCGVGLSSGEIFDSSWTRGEPISFPLDGLIQGWIDGLPGMKVGGKRVLVIPGALAYGSTPPPGIEPDETLAFAIELISAS
jgi:peptidylprolyl isomerase